jgi:hypothetical protein
LASALVRVEMSGRDLGFAVLAMTNGYDEDCSEKRRPRDPNLSTLFCGERSAHCAG